MRLLISEIPCESDYIEEVDGFTVMSMEVLAAQEEIVAAAEGLMSFMGIVEEIKTTGYTVEMEKRYGEMLKGANVEISTEGFFSKIRDGIVWLWTKIKNFVKRIGAWFKSFWTGVKEEKEKERLAEITKLTIAVKNNPNPTKLAQPVKVTQLAELMKLGSFLLDMRKVWDDVVNYHLTFLIRPVVDDKDMDKEFKITEGKCGAAAEQLNQKLAEIQRKEHDVDFYTSDWMLLGLTDKYESLLKVLQQQIEQATKDTEKLVVQQENSPVVRVLLTNSNINAPANNAAAAPEEIAKYKCYKYHLDAIIKVLVLRCEKTIRLAVAARDIMRTDQIKVLNALKEMNTTKA